MQLRLSYCLISVVLLGLKMKKILGVAAFLILGFYDAGESDHVIIFAEALAGISAPTPENIETQADNIMTGTHRAGLIYSAETHCPSGYRIIEESVPKANVYAFEPKLQYRVNQNFVIVCTVGGLWFW